MAKLPIPSFTNSAVKRALKEAIAGDRASRLILQRTARRECFSNCDAVMAHREAMVAVVLLDVKASLDRIESQADVDMMVAALRSGRQARDNLETYTRSHDVALKSAADEALRFLHHLHEWEAIVESEKRTRPKFF